MNAGALDRKICLLKGTDSKDSAGAPVTTWAFQFDLWAERLQVNASEQQVADEARGTQVETMRIRFSACLEKQETLGSYRVRYNGRDYTILATVEDLTRPRRSFMRMTFAFIQGEPTLTTATVPAA